jgi:hypothetical protein
MSTPILPNRLTQLLTPNIQLMYGILKSGGGVIDKTDTTITIDAPILYVYEDLKQQRDLVQQRMNEYLALVQQQDPNASIPQNEEMMFLDVLKMYNTVLQYLES